MSNIQRKVAELLPDVVINVKDFGAVGNGVTDDTAAVKAAMTYASSLDFPPVIFFPAGEYVITDELVFDFLCTIEGVGKNTRILKKSAVDGFDLRSGNTIRDLYIDGAGSTGGNGIRISNGRCNLINIVSNNNPESGVLFTDNGNTTNCNFSKATNVYLINNGKNGIHILADSAVPDANVISLINIEARLNGNDALKIENAVSTNLFSLLSENNLHTIEIINGDANFLAGIYFESDTSIPITIDANSYQNVIFALRTRGLDASGSAVSDNGHYNLILMISSSSGTITATHLGVQNLQINNEALSGRFTISQDGTNRNLLIEKSGTSEIMDIDISSLGAGKGLVVTGADGNRYRIYVDSSGSIAVAAV